MDEQKAPGEDKDAEAPGGQGAGSSILFFFFLGGGGSSRRAAEGHLPCSRCGRALGGDGQRRGGPPETPRRSLRGAGAGERGHRGSSPGRQVRIWGGGGLGGGLDFWGRFCTSPTPSVPPPRSAPARRCALCNCGDWSLHGQRELQRFEPEPDWPERLRGGLEPPEGPGEAPQELEPAGDDLAQVGFSERVSAAQLFEPTGEWGPRGGSLMPWGVLKPRGGPKAPWGSLSHGDPGS